MTKKEYIQPMMNVVELKSEQILAGSTSTQSLWDDNEGTFGGSKEEEEL